MCPPTRLSTPTYNRDLVHATVKLVELGVSGTLHLCGPELLSRIDFARQVAGLFDLDASLLDPVPTLALGQRAARPLDAGLSTEALQRLFPQLRMRTRRGKHSKTAGGSWTPFDRSC